MDTFHNIPQPLLNCRGRGFLTTESALLLFIFVIEWFLFRSYVLREIASGFPTSFDQSVYLARYYTDYESILNGSLLRFILKPLYGGYSDVAQGLWLNYQAVLLSVIFGASRLVALSINFIYYLALQLFFYKGVKSITHDSPSAFICFGMLLALGTPFLFAGGMFDFRPDFIAFCIFGILTSSVIISGAFLDRKWSVVAGAFAGLLILTRYLTSIYICVIYLIFTLPILIAVIRGFGRHRAEISIIRIKNIIVSGFCILLISVVPLLLSLKSTMYYYGSVSTDSYTVWSMEHGISSLYGNIIFYSTHILHQVYSSVWIFFASLLALLFFSIFNKKHLDTQARSDKSIDINLSLLFSTLAVAVPSIILTRIKSSNECVISIIIIPMLYILSIIFIKLYTKCIATNVFKYAGMLILGIGLFTNISNYSKHGFHFANRQDSDQVSALYTKIGQMCETYNIVAPRIVTDSVRHYFVEKLLLDIYYEKFNRLISPNDMLASDIFLNNPKVALDLVGKSDFAIITYKNAASDSIYPIANTIESIRPEMLDLVRKRFIHIDTFFIEHRIVDLFMKPLFRVEGLDGDWITSDGLLLEVAPEFIKGGASLILTGIFNREWLPVDKVEAASRIVLPVEAQSGLKTELRGEGNRYTIEILFPENFDAGAMKGPVQVRLDFSGYFVPSELGINDDRRKLVFFAPTEKKVIYTTPESNVKLKSVEGGYDRETDDTGWWRWSSNALKFQYEIEGLKEAKSLSIRFQYSCASDRSINIAARGSDSSKEMVIHCQEGVHSYVVEAPSSKDRLDITFTSPEPAVPLSDSDPRMGKFMIRNLEVVSN